MEDLNFYIIVGSLIFLSLLIFWFVNSPNKFLYEHLMTYPYPNSDLEQLYHGSDCIKDGTCRLPPNNDSFFYYPSNPNVTELTKIKCQSSDHKSCHLSNCSGLLNSPECFGGCTRP